MTRRRQQSRWCSAIKPSNSAMAEQRVKVDSLYRGAGVDVRLDRTIDDGETRLVILPGQDITGDDAEFPVTLCVRAPFALHALISALLGLIENPHGAKILRTIRDERRNVADDDAGVCL